MTAERYAPVYVLPVHLFGAPPPSEESKREYRRTEKRARKLLRAHLAKRQLACFDKFGLIKVKGSHTGRTYHIDCAGSHGGNIYCREADKWYCAVLSDGGLFPRSDHVLAQKLLIETNERKFLRIAVRL